MKISLLVTAKGAVTLRSGPPAPSSTTFVFSCIFACISLIFGKCYSNKFTFTYKLFTTTVLPKAQHCVSKAYSVCALAQYVETLQEQLGDLQNQTGAKRCAGAPAKLGSFKK